jgi:diguanylate cyclase (GGDEF)-like protein
MREHSGMTQNQINDAIPIGILMVDGSFRVRHWNQWLIDKTGISAERALGQTLKDLFPDMHNPRFDSAVESVINRKSPQIMSQALNNFLIPIHIEQSKQQNLNMMQQQVHVMPYFDGDESLAVVSVIDVTGNILRSFALMTVTQEYHNQSNRDELTSLYNRRFLWSWLEPSLKQCVRYKYSLSCLMLDIDHFKRFNDNHGHSKGDEILNEFAGVLMVQFRDSDILVRYGGEEFVVLLPNCDLPNACEVGRRLLETLRITAMAGLNIGDVSCSIGVTAFDPEQPIAAEALLKQADKQLYLAKNNGRDCLMP